MISANFAILLPIVFVPSIYTQFSLYILALCPGEVETQAVQLDARSGECSIFKLSLLSAQRSLRVKLTRGIETFTHDVQAFMRLKVLKGCCIGNTVGSSSTYLLQFIQLLPLL